MDKKLIDDDFWFYLTKHNSGNTYTQKQIAIALDQASQDFEDW